MKETAAQYIHRMLAYIKGCDPIRVQRATAQKIRRLIRGLTPRQLRRRPAPGKWSIAEIVAHLADSELVIGYRIRMIIAANRTPIANFDQNFLAGAGIYQRQNTADSLAEFSALRKKNLRLLRILPRKLWNNYGIHELRGKESVTQIVRLYAGHDINHVRQIESIRAHLPKK